MLNWYDDNQGRAYPFLADTTGRSDAAPDVLAIPNETVEDFGCTVGVSSDFQSTDKVYLKSLRRNGDLLTFDFRSDAAGLLQYRLVFRRRIDDPPHTVEFVGASQTAPTVDCPDPSRWQGFLVTGHLQPLADLLADGQEWTGTGETAVEPRTITNLSKAFVRSFSLANQTRTRATEPVGCPPLSWSSAQRYYVQAECLTGPARLLAGYNVGLLTDDFNRKLTITAKKGEGAGEPCSEVPRYVGEAPPPGRTLLDGSLRCSEVVRSFAGLSGKTIEITGGPGISVSFDPVQHKIILNGDGAGVVR